MPLFSSPRSIVRPITRSITYPSTGRLLEAGIVNPDAAVQAMFANGEQGAYLQADPATMYTDSFGVANPVVDSDTVGFMWGRQYADQQGELAPDPSFKSGTGGFSATTGSIEWDSANERLGIRNTAGGADGVAEWSFPTVVGRAYTYRAVFEEVSGSGGHCRILDANGDFIIDTGPTSGRFDATDTFINTFEATTATTRVQLANRPGGGDSGINYWRLISVFPGVCAYQTAPGSRNALNSLAGQNVSAFDGVDDFDDSAGLLSLVSPLNQWTICAAYQVPNLSTEKPLLSVLGGTASHVILRALPDGRMQFFDRSGLSPTVETLQHSTGVITTNQWQIVTVYRTATAYGMRLNGAQQFEAAYSPNAAGVSERTSAIWGARGRATIEAYGQVSFGERLVIDRVLTAQEHADNEQRLAAKYGITLP